MISLPAPACFTPWSNGIYSVAPGLRALGVDFGNGEADRKLLLLDSEFPRYRANKESCLREARDRHWATADFRDIEGAVFRRLAERVAADYPNYFHWQENALDCAITGERIAVEGGALAGSSALPSAVESPLEAFALQVQADLAVVRRAGERDWLAAAHVCAPSSWSPRKKVGRAFFDVHLPVPAFEKVNAVSGRLVDALVRQGSFIRFVWGVASDDHLNHHPELGVERGAFEKGQFWVRIERQTTLGLPELDAAVFCIHVQTIPGGWVLERPHLRDALARGLRSMTLEAQQYKSVDRQYERLLSLLSDPAD